MESERSCSGLEVELFPFPSLTVSKSTHVYPTPDLRAPALGMMRLHSRFPLGSLRDTGQVTISSAAVPPLLNGGTVLWTLHPPPVAIFTSSKRVSSGSKPGKVSPEHCMGTNGSKRWSMKTHVSYHGVWKPTTSPARRCPALPHLGLTSSARHISPLAEQQPIFSLAARATPS